MLETEPSRSETICVAMCTFRGAAYLGEQLASIARQTRLPDRMMVLDDGSDDGTVEIAERFARGAPFPVRVLVNERNLGPVQNFEQAIRLAEGSLIALADQDDVWHPEKLAESERAFRSAPEVGLVFSDAEVVDQSLRPLGFGLWESVFFTPERQRQASEQDLFSVLLRGSVVTGATLTFRSELRQVVLPIPAGCWHDGWIALIGSALFRAVPLARPLLRYRQHASNQVGAQARPGWAGRLARARVERQQGLAPLAAQLRAARERLAGLPEPPASALARLDDAIAHLELRMRLPVRRARRLRLVGREVARGRYARWSNGWKTALRDLTV